MFKISEAANLAIHAMAVLANQPEDAYLPATAITEKLHCSPSHLAKVLNGLADRGLVESSRGAKGGYRLPGTHRTISALDVLEAVDGEVPVEGCLLGQPICHQHACAFQDLFVDLREQFVRRLKEVRLVDFPIKP